MQIMESQGQTVHRPKTERPLWAMLAALTATFAWSHAFRTVAAIMAAQVQSEFAVSAQALGILAGSFHLSFCAMQLVIGVTHDIYGPRRTVGVAFLIAAFGAVVSAFAPSFSILMAGQLLIGIGCAPAFLATMVFVANRYPADQFTRLSGLVLGCGGLGMLITGTPLAWVVQTWSWRAGFLVLAASSAFAWLAIVTFVSDGSQVRQQERETLGAAFRQVGTIFAEKHTLGIVILGAVTYASFITLRGLWLAPLFVDRHGYTLVQSGHVVLAASIATLFGPPMFGRLDPGGYARRNWIVGCTVAFACLFAVLAFGAPTTIDVGVAIFVGFLAGYMVLQYTDVRAAYSSKVAGRALAVFNMAMFLGVALMQWVCGLSASIAKAHNADPFVAVFVTIAALLVVGTLASVLLPWPNGLPENETGGLKSLVSRFPIFHKYTSPKPFFDSDGTKEIARFSKIGSSVLSKVTADEAPQPEKGALL
jgi:predicted MFS family arabinose efflux permease